MTPRFGAFTLVVTAGVLAACTTDVSGQALPTQNTSTGGNAVATPLQDRPSSDETVARYDGMQTSARDAVAAADPIVEWTPRREGSSAGCGDPGPGQVGDTIGLPRWGSQGGISDETWPAVVGAVNRSIAPYDFGELTPIVDRTDDHLEQAVGPYGATLQIGTAVNVILSVRTGCHPR